MTSTTTPPAPAPDAPAPTILDTVGVVAEAIRAVGHPFRLLVLAAVADAEDTPTGCTSAVAIHDRTGIPLGTVAYHVRVLRIGQRLEVAREVRVRGATRTDLRLTPRGRADLARIRSLWGQS